MAREGSGNDHGRRIPDQLPARRWSSCRYRHRPREDRGCRRRHGPRALRHADIWSAAACHSGDMELCYLPDMPTVLAGAANAIERWWQQLETAQKHLEGSFKVVNALAMAASYDPDPTQFLGIRLPVTFDTCEVIEERWANWLRQDPVVAVETQANNLRRLKALYIDCGEKDQFNLLYGARRFVRRLNELGIAHRYEEFPDNHSAVDYRMDESLPFLAQALFGGSVGSGPGVD